MKLTLTTFLTLDGVVAAPGGPDEDRDGGFPHGGWAIPYVDSDFSELVEGWLAQAGAFLLGRRTYQIFAAHWPRVGDENLIAAALNKHPKYVVSTTLSSPTWQGTTVLGADFAARVAALKDQPGAELQVHGSGRLARALMAHGLIDEYRLCVYPVLVGSGARLFEDPTHVAALRLTDVVSTASGVVAHIYVPDGALRYGSAELTDEPEGHRVLR